MSEELPPKSGVWQGIGCALLGMIFIVASGFLFLMSIFGQCGAWAGADCVQPSQFEIYALFPGGPIVLAVIGYFIFRSSKRGSD